MKCVCIFSDFKMTFIGSKHIKNCSFYLRCTTKRLFFELTTCGKGVGFCKENFLRPSSFKKIINFWFWDGEPKLRQAIVLFPFSVKVVFCHFCIFMKFCQVLKLILGFPINFSEIKILDYKTNSKKTRYQVRFNSWIWLVLGVYF